MKKWFKIIGLSIRNTGILIIILELFLYFLFQYNDVKRYRKNVDFKIASGAYQDLDPKIVKDMYDELYTMDSEWAPYVHFRFKESTGKYQNIDSNGFRKTLNYNLKDSKTAFKIFCLGGSTLFGTGVRDEYSIPSRLSQYIYNMFPDKNIEIINFGAPGYTRTIENILLQLELLADHKPDMVIFYDGVNEIISAQENRKAGYPTNASNRKNEFKTGFSYAKKISLLFSSSKIKRMITYLQLKIFKTKPMEVANPENLSSQVAQQYIRSLEITKALGKQYDFEVYNFFQPIIYLNKSLTEHEKIMSKNAFHFEKLYFNTYKNILENYELKKDSTFIDISSIFVKDTHTIYTDFCHIAERGNDSIAKKIFTVLEPSIAKKGLKTMNIQTEKPQSFQ